MKKLVCPRFAMPASLIACSLLSNGRPALIAATAGTVALVPVLAKAYTTWTSYQIGHANSAPEHSVVRVGSDDKPRVLIGGTSLVYRKLTGTLGAYYPPYGSGPWSETNIASTAQGIDFVLDAQDNPHISYARTTTTQIEVVHAYLSGSTWNYEVVTSFALPTTPKGGRGCTTKIRIDGSGNVHVGIYENSSDQDVSNNLYSTDHIYHAVKSSSGWSISTVSTDSWSSVSGGTFLTAGDMDLDSQGNAHFAYFWTNDSGTSTSDYIKYNNGSSVTTLNYAPGHSATLRMRVDANGVAHLVFTSGASWDVYYLTVSGGSVTSTRTVGHAYNATLSLTLDAQNKAHIVCDEYSTNSWVLTYQRMENGLWVSDTVTSLSGNGSQNSAVALDSQSKPYVLYDATGGSTLIAKP